MRERVLVELEWYDGPRVGVAYVKGVPHRFSSNYDETDDEYLGSFKVWPINELDLSYEVEQWKIFVDWNNEYELGKADTSTHPGTGGINKRWDELQVILKQSREFHPSSMHTLRAEFFSMENRIRYDYSGPDYMLSWHVV